MEQPTITDWIQSITAGLALIIAVTSLGWQIKNARAARRQRVSLEAERWGPSAWKVNLAVEGDDRSTALTAKVRLKGRHALSIVDAEDLPWEVDNSTLVFTFPRRDIRQVSRQPVARVLRVSLSHESPPSRVASTEFALAVAEGTTAVSVSVDVFAEGRRLPLISRTMLISPTR